MRPKRSISTSSVALPISRMESRACFSSSISATFSSSAGNGAREDLLLLDVEHKVGGGATVGGEGGGAISQRDDHALHPEFLGEGESVERARATIGVDQEVPRIIPAHHRLLPDELGRSRVVDPHDARRRFLGAETHLLAEAARSPQGPPRGRAACGRRGSSRATADPRRDRRRLPSARCRLAGSTRGQGRRRRSPDPLVWSGYADRRGQGYRRRTRSTWSEAGEACIDSGR